MNNVISSGEHAGFKWIVRDMLPMEPKFCKRTTENHRRFLNRYQGYVLIGESHPWSKNANRGACRTKCWGTVLDIEIFDFNGDVYASVPSMCLDESYHKMECERFCECVRTAKWSESAYLVSS